MEFVMRTLKSLSSFALVAALIGISAHTNAATLTINITEIQKPTGKLMIKLVNSAQAYDGKAEASAKRMIEVSSKDNVSLQFADLAPGSYAVMIMHDENSNGKLDSNILGIPKEAYGFSNNPHVMRQPTFDETKFQVSDKDSTINIELL
jgi:uncharacterized protein (DUF2141 family)